MRANNKISKALIGNISILTLFMLLQAFSPAAGTDSIQVSGIGAAIDSITSSVNDLKNIVADVKNFMSGLGDFFQKIASFTSAIGISTVILFIAVIIFSSGLSAIGVPKGKASFILSLAAADTIWTLWEFSFGRRLEEFLSAMAKSNLIILAPLLLVWMVKLLWPMISKKIKALIFSSKYRSVSRNDLIELSKKFHTDWSEFQVSLASDIMESDEKENVKISPGTLELAKRLQQNISSMEKIK